jgi:hypothetical protein
MAKIFRHHIGTDTLIDWDASSPYRASTIDQITDPDGGNASNEITSIPSPFARMDLVKTAFKEVAATGVSLEGNTIYHKMVSDALDVGQIFFNFDQMSDKINILSWDRRTDLQNLLDSANKSHQLFGRTLELFLKQDAGAYNFDALQRIFLLEQPGHGSSKMQVLGGTSPSTIFFGTANDLTGAQFQFDSDYTFDEYYRSLDKRDPDYIKFWFYLRNCIPHFSSRFPEVNEYLTKVYANLAEVKFKAELNDLDINSYESNLHPISAEDIGVTVEVCGFNILQKNVKTLVEEIPTLSDFVIGTSKEFERPPLVLPNETNTQGWKYINDPWSSSNKAPHFDPKQLGRRNLPHSNVPYPYLTISDFLEPYIMKLPYEVEDKYFFNGNYKGEHKGYILPIKKEIFKYFDIDTIKGVSSNGEPFFELEDTANGVKAILRIPIKGNKIITFERYYMQQASQVVLADISEEENKGAIVDMPIGINLFPIVKPTYTNGIFKASIIDLSENPLIASDSWDMHFYDDANSDVPVNLKYTSIDRKLDGRLDHIVHFNVGQNFNYTVIQNNSFSGLILPIFKIVERGMARFKFAVDFGTTNTHIEYLQEGREGTYPFEITKEDAQMVTMYKDITSDMEVARRRTLGLEELETSLTRTIVPFEIGSNNYLRFPIRTSLQVSKRYNFNHTAKSFVTSSVPFHLFKDAIEKGFDVSTHLKWSTLSDSGELGMQNLKKIESYFDNLLFLIRNKVLQNGGDLSNTELVWTYPSSMSTFRLNSLEEVWNDLFSRYFEGSEIPKKISESIAPFIYYSKKKGVNSLSHPVIGLDIGGGTSDIIIYSKDKAQLISSFKFGGNALFGDGYNSNKDLNGFVQRFIPEAIQFLDDNSLTFKITFSEIVKDFDSGDIVSALFALEDNQKLVEEGKNFKFTESLKNESDLKAVFLIFYSALFYHLGKISKTKNFTLPRHLILSGTASKTAKILDPSPDSKTIKLLVTNIFKQLDVDSSNASIDIEHDRNPKEMTARGSLMAKSYGEDDLFYIQHSNMEENKKLTYQEAESEDHLSSVYDEYLHFIDVLRGIGNEIDLEDKFGISSTAFATSIDILLQDYKSDTLMGLKKKMEDENAPSNKELKETMFFYPLIGRLNKIALSLYKNKAQ